jgi:hypothetical protein
MSDKYMLEMAAKAMGYELDFESYTAMNLHRPMATHIGDEHTWFAWNPLASSANCFEMETAIGIDVLWFDDHITALPYRDEAINVQEYFANHSNDKNAARRMASCRVAMAIGEKK